MTASARGSSSSAPGAPVTSGRCRSTPTRTPRARGAGAGAPVSTAWASPQSATVRAIGPTVSKLGASGKTPSTETAPSAGLRPTTPQAPAGSRTEPPVSVPSARGTSPAASAAALPPLEPPAMRSGCRGLTTSPKCGFRPATPQANSSALALPTTIAPSASSAATAGAVRRGTWSAKILDA